MTKLAKKFLFSISLILIIVTGISVAVNSKFVERYYIHLKKEKLDLSADQLLAHDKADGVNGLSEVTLSRLEASNNVVIAVIDTYDDINELNEKLKYAFLKKGLGLAKYWLWDQDYEKTLREGRWMRIYRQERMNYSLAVEYVDLGGRLAGIAMVIPDTEEMIGLINFCTMVIFGGALIAIILLCAFLVRRITKPLAAMEAFAAEIANQNYVKIEINTGDELETVAKSMNEMSEAIRINQTRLKEKNRQMENLLNNVSHDLKTPVSLIKAYTSGMKDGMDDGTFLDTVIRQNEKMEDIIEKILYLSRLGHGKAEYEMVDVGLLLSEQLKVLELDIKSRGLTVRIRAWEPAVLQGDRNAIRCIVENLLTNAVKYATGDFVDIRLADKKGRILFEVENETVLEPTEPGQLWEPFYVGEESRNRNLSGTGLGLSLVRAAARQYGYEYGYRVKDGRILFSILL